MCHRAVWLFPANVPLRRSVVGYRLLTILSKLCDKVLSSAIGPRKLTASSTIYMGSKSWNSDIHAWIDPGRWSWIVGTLRRFGIGRNLKWGDTDVFASSVKVSDPSTRDPCSDTEVSLEFLLQSSQLDIGITPVLHPCGSFSPSSTATEGNIPWRHTQRHI